jgi:hypothetical protein
MLKDEGKFRVCRGIYLTGGAGSGRLLFCMITSTGGPRDLIPILREFSFFRVMIMWLSIAILINTSEKLNFGSISRTFDVTAFEVVSPLEHSPISIKI